MGADGDVEGTNHAFPAQTSQLPPMQHVTAPQQQLYDPSPMFHVSNLSGSKSKPGTWIPSGKWIYY